MTGPITDGSLFLFSMSMVAQQRFHIMCSVVHSDTDTVMRYPCTRPVGQRSLNRRGSTRFSYISSHAPSHSQEPKVEAGHVLTYMAYGSTVVLLSLSKRSLAL